MGNEPEVQSRVPSEDSGAKPVKLSKAVKKLLRACCIVELIGKWQILKNRVVTFGQLKFKIEPASSESDILLYFYNDKGNLETPERAVEHFAEWEIKFPQEFIALGKDIVSRELQQIEPVKYVKGSFAVIEKIRARMSEAEKRWLDRKMTALETSRFYQQQPEWSVLK